MLMTDTTPFDKMESALNRKLSAVRLGLAAFAAAALMALPLTAGAGEAPAAANASPVVENAAGTADGLVHPVDSRAIDAVVTAAEKNAAKGAEPAFDIPAAPSENPASRSSPTAISAEFDPVKNPRVYEISLELRCLVCQNESIAESNADLAIDLRREVARLVEAGRTNDEVIEYMTERYGDYVLYKPPFKAKTVLLWCGPFLFLVLALWVVWSVVRRRRDDLAREEMSPSLVEALRLVRMREFDVEAGKDAGAVRTVADIADLSSANDSKKEH